MIKTKQNKKRAAVVQRGYTAVGCFVAPLGENSVYVCSACVRVGVPALKGSLVLCLGHQNVSCVTSDSPQYNQQTQTRYVAAQNTA
jgi:hypothetical protein